MRYSTAIIGGGMAAARLLTQLKALSYEGSVVVISEESHFGYNRVLLPQLLGGDCTLNDLMTAPLESESTHIVSDCIAEVVDPLNRIIHTNRGEFEYQNVVFATGSAVPEPVCLQGVKAINKMALRTLADAEQLRSLFTHSSQQQRTAVILGGGLLGLEVGSALLQLGLRVCVIHRSDRVLNRQLDHRGALALEQELEAQGFEIYLKREIADVDVDDANNIKKVRLNDGTTIESDVLLLATGTEPRTALARNSGASCQRGIVVDAGLETSLKGHFAIGECAEYQGEICGLVAPTHLQADVLAQNLCGDIAQYKPPEHFTQLKVGGTELFSAGDLSAGDQEVCIRSSDNKIYRRLNFSQQTLTGAVFFGDITGASAIKQYLGQVVNEPSVREQLAFGL
ncbi:MAG: nitrite reductase (NADH) large subunit [Candidatus Azotimanducaceae bacterium]|jgi:nitrite reductase (NADH) large subunit